MSRFLGKTGIGNHSKNEKFAMKNSILEFLQTMCPALTVEEVDGNLGQLQIRFPSMQMPA